MISAVCDFLVRMLPGVVPAAVLYCCLLPVRKKRLFRGGLVSSVPREAALLLCFLFCGGLGVLTLTPRWFHWLSLLQADGNSLPAFFRPGSVNLIPFQTFAADSWSLMILLGNVVMFLPIGFFAVLLWRKVSQRQLLALGLSVTLFVECWQLLIGRSFDIDDLTLNLLGVWLGGLLCRLLYRAFPQFFRSFQVYHS